MLAHSKPDYIEFFKGAVIGAALVFLWILPSTAAILADWPGLFQRLGAMGIIWAILVFTVGRRYLIEIENQLHDPIIESKIKGLLSEVSDVSVRLSEIELEIEMSRGSKKIDENLSPSELDVAISRVQALRTLSSESKGWLLEAQKLLLTGRVLLFGARWFEILVLVLATFQSGFGDWFVCSVNSGSLSTC